MYILFLHIITYECTYVPICLRIYIYIYVHICLYTHIVCIIIVWRFIMYIALQYRCCFRLRSQGNPTDGTRPDGLGLGSTRV